MGRRRSASSLTSISPWRLRLLSVCIVTLLLLVAISQLVAHFFMIDRWSGASQQGHQQSDSGQSQLHPGDTSMLLQSRHDEAQITPMRSSSPEAGKDAGVNRLMVGNIMHMNVPCPHAGAAQYQYFHFSPTNVQPAAQTATLMLPTLPSAQAVLAETVQHPDGGDEQTVLVEAWPDPESVAKQKDWPVW